MKNNFKKAFSLIEISMVILIIGILIAGISKSIDMVYDMRLATARALTNKAPVGSIENLEMWLEATSEDSFATGTASFVNVKNPEDGQTIGRWNDLNPVALDSSYKNHASQATLGNQPLYIKEGISGLPALLFDGFDDFLVAGDGKTNFSEFTIFFVLHPRFKSSTGGNNSNIINIACSGVGACRTLNSGGGYTSSFAGGNPSAWIFITYGATPSANASFGYMQSKEINPGSGGTASTDISYQSYGLSFVNTDIARIAQVNHGARVTLSLTPKMTASGNPAPLMTGNSYLDFRIGAQKNTGEGYRLYKGYISEIILFGRSLDNQETKLIENYLSEKWRIKL